MPRVFEIRMPSDTHTAIKCEEWDQFRWRFCSETDVIMTVPTAAIAREVRCLAIYHAPYRRVRVWAKRV